MTLTPLLLAAGTTTVAGALLVMVRRLLPRDPERPHQETAGAIFSVVGVLHAVILAFVVIVVWENDRKARDDIQVEASAVARVYFTARALPAPQQHELMTLSRDYAATVAHEEWRLMAGGHTSPRARQQVAAMRVTTHELRPATGDQEILMTSTLDAIDALVEARRERTAALTAPVSPIMWLGLAVSSALTVAFTFLFDRSRLGLHLVMVGSVTALITFMLWLIHDMSLPYSGTSAVGPEAFEQILQRFREFPPDVG